jgi:hypothetical protein
MPRIKTTRTVRFALWALRIYLLVLLILIGIKFVRVFSSSHKQDNSTPNPSAMTTVATNQSGTLKETSAHLQ